MATTAGDVLIDVLHDWGVDVIFGLPGDGVDGIMEALRKRQHDIRFIHVRHEEAAAFMACAYAKFTGKLGVCLGTSGPGGIHLLNGLYDAKMDGQPVVAITGMQFHDLVNTFQQQDVLLDRLFENVAVYNAQVMGPSHMENVAELACRSAMTYRGVSHITTPIDYQTAPVDRNHTPRNVPHHVSEVFAESGHLPTDEDLNAAAEILNSGKKIAIIAGRGALDAGPELLQVAQKLQAPIIKPLLGKAVVPDESPYTTGGIGLLGTKPSQEALEDCDTLLIVGSSFPYIEYYPKPGQAKGIQIDLAPERIGIRYPVEIGLVSDSKLTLQSLLPKLQHRQDGAFLKKAQDRMRDWERLMEERGTNQGKPMKPQVVAHELNKRLSNDAIITSDSGTIATWTARYVKIRGDQQFSLSGNLATMANGFPYAIAAQIAYPDRQCVAMVGDGGFSMLMAEFSTCVKYNLPVKVIIFKNNVLGQIRWEQMVFMGNPEYGVSLEPIDHAAFARACGGTGFTIEDPANCGDILGQALATPGPVIIDAVVDPYEPPYPAKITPEQAKKLAEALARGEPNREKIAMTILSDKVRELI